MKKIVIGAALGLCLACNASMPAAAFASSETGNAATGNSIGVGIIEPFWVNVTSTKLSMSYSGGTIDCVGIITGKSNVASINATFKLEKKGTSGTYSPVKSWNASTSTTKLTNSNPVSGTSGTYRLSVTATVKTTSGGTETVEDSVVQTL